MTILRPVYRKMRREISMLITASRLRRLERMGLYKYSHIIPARPSVKLFSQSEALRKLYYDTFRVPNISGFYHGILRDLWENYGLGRECLLVSESTETRKAFSQRFPQTTFTATDYYVDLQSCAQTDVFLDNCSTEIPESLRYGFDSIECQET